MVLRSLIRQREPDHWLVRQFDAKFPHHDENAVRNGATNLGVLPHFTPDNKLMELLMRKGDGTEREQQQAKSAKDAATHDVRRTASEAGAAAGSGARFATPSFSSNDSMDSRPSRQQPKKQQEQQNGWRSDSDDTPARSTGEWGSSLSAQRKLKVRYNEFGDEIIEEQEMEKD